MISSLGLRWRTGIKRRRLKHVLVLAASLVFASIASAAEAGADGARLYQVKGCSHCHGNEGRIPVQPNYPKLAGQNLAYLMRQMKDIKSGRRDNAESRTMRTIMEFVNETEMKLIAKYLSRL